jgi:hypothetical protein
MAPETRLNEIERHEWIGTDTANQTQTVDAAAEETLFDYEDVRDYDLGEGD